MALLTVLKRLEYKGGRTEAVGAEPIISAGGAGGALGLLGYCLRARRAPYSPKVCVPKTAQINISFCKVSFFPAMKSGSEGGGGVLDTPPTPNPRGNAELFSKTLVPGGGRSRRRRPALGLCRE